MDLVERMGVDRLTDGRLSSAGLMSGIVTAVVSRRRGGAVARREQHYAAGKGFLMSA